MKLNELARHHSALTQRAAERVTVPPPRWIRPPRRRPKLAAVAAAAVIVAFLIGGAAVLTLLSDPVENTPATQPSITSVTVTPTTTLPPTTIQPSPAAVLFDEVLVDEWVAVSDTRLGMGFTLGPDGLPLLPYWGSTVEAVYLDEPDPTTVRLLRCLDETCLTFEVVDLDTIDAWPAKPFVGVLPDGSPVFVEEVAFIDEGVEPEGAEADEVHPVIRLTVCDDPDCREVTETIIDDDEPCNTRPGCHWVGAPRVLIGNSGFPVITFASGQPPKVKVMACADRVCSSGETRTLWEDSAGALSAGFDTLGRLRFTPDGDFGIRFASCGDESCSTGIISETILSADNGWSDWVFYGPTGLPNAWLWVLNGDESGLGVEIAACADPLCETVERFTPGFTAPFGFAGPDTPQWDSAEMPLRLAGTDGLPVMIFGVGEDAFSEYHGESMGIGTHIMVTKCDDVGCSSGTTTEVAYPHLTQEQFDQGWFWHGGAVTATIRANGLPLIAYGDIDGLHLIRCPNVACLPPDA